MFFQEKIEIGFTYLDKLLLSAYKKIKSSIPLSNILFSHLKIITLFVTIIISIIIIYQSLFYRWFGYETIPMPITDEFNYVWQALSLRQYGLPVGWVTFSYIYKEPKYQTRGANLEGLGIISEGKRIDLYQFQKDRRPLVAIEEINYLKGKEYMFFATPFFDHPPLGGLIYSLGENKNIKEFKQVKPAEFRRPALALAVITAILLFIFICLITDNPWIALLTVIIYSTVPTYLLATRTAFLENAEAPFILLHLIILFGAIQLQKRRTAFKVIPFIFALSGFIGGLGFLVKEPALGFLIGSTILLIKNNVPKKYLSIFLIALFTPIVSYFIWGLWLQKDLFIEVLKANSERGYFGALKLVTMLEALKFKDFPTDGWWIWGLLSFLIISLKIKQSNLQFLIFPLLFHFLLILFLASPNYSWYFISMIPLLAGCSAIAIWQIIENPKIAISLAFFLIPFSSSYYWGRVSLSLPPSIAHYRYAFIIFSMLLIFRLVFSKHFTIKIIWYIFWAILIEKIITFNQIFMPYLISHWGNLPIPSLPNF